MLRSLLMVSIVLSTAFASAATRSRSAKHHPRARSVAKSAPRCLDLPKKQAEKAVTLAKIAMSKGSPLIFQSSKESGLVAPLGIWTEAHKTKKGKVAYRVKADGRDLDISLVYVAKSKNDKKAYNLAWMSGCRPAIHKPISIDNF